MKYIIKPKRSPQNQYVIFVDHSKSTATLALHLMTNLVNSGKFFTFNVQDFIPFELYYCTDQMEKLIQVKDKLFPAIWNAHFVCDVENMKGGEKTYIRRQLYEYEQVILNNESRQGDQSN